MVIGPFDQPPELLWIDRILHYLEHLTILRRKYRQPLWFQPWFQSGAHRFRPCTLSLLLVPFFSPRAVKLGFSGVFLFKQSAGNGAFFVSRFRKVLKRHRMFFWFLPKGGSICLSICPALVLMLMCGAGFWICRLCLPLFVFARFFSGKLRGFWELRAARVHVRVPAPDFFFLLGMPVLICGSEF